jgi:4-amino-4-deoxy-L-arabinose transferase-like glycosyltransferase
MSERTVHGVRHFLLIVIALTILAAVPRFYGLGSLGFYGDEETTAFPARALAEGKGPKMPTGMPYYRAAPFTWLNAMSAHVFGPDREMSYRVPAAFFGTLTIPMLFVMCRPLVGTPIALVAALLLALSEWHIATSREARMYAPFLFFYVGAAFATLRWVTTGQAQYLMLAALLFAVSASLHKLALIGILFVIIPVGFAGWARVAPAKLVVAAVIAGMGAWAYDKYFVSPAFTSWFPVQTALSTPSAPQASSWLPLPFASLPTWSPALMLLGAALGIWAANRAEPVDDLPGSILRSMGRYASAMLAGGLACIGQLYGGLIATLVFLYLHPTERVALAKQIWLPSTIIILISTIFSGMTISQVGLIRGLRMLISFPFPYPALFAEMFPLVLLLFAGALMYFALRPHQPDQFPLQACLLAVIIPVAAVGAVSRWGGTRYLIEVYPFLLITAAAALLGILNVLGRVSRLWSHKTALALAVGIAVSGVLTGHGIPQARAVATLDPGGLVNQWVYAYPLYPDHRTPGEFVRRNLAPNDIVIAEDPLQQRWYVGQVDYWFRNPDVVRRYLYEDVNGYHRDIYVGSRLLREIDDIASLTQQTRGKLWFITSGETYSKREYYLNDQQRRWLDSLENSKTPLFVGHDNVTKVYCLNCDR